MKSWVTPTTLISSCFKMLFSGIWSYEIRIFYPLVDVSIRFSPLLDFVLDAYGEVNIHFVLFEFVVVFLLWGTTTFGLYGDTTMGMPWGQLYLSIKYHNLKYVNLQKEGAKDKSIKILLYMTTFHNFAVRMETGWATRVVKPILKIINVINRC